MQNRDKHNKKSLYYEMIRETKDGDSFFEKKTYNRLDIIYTPFLYKRVKGQFILSLHQTPGYSSNQEAFRVTVDLGRQTLVRFKD